MNIYAVQGLDNSYAIAVDDSADDAEFFAIEGKTLPDMFEEFIDSQR